MEGEALLRLAALVSAVCGMGVLQAAWRIKNANGPRLVGGWSLILGSIIAWGITSSADKGAALGIVAVILVALMFLLSNALRSQVRPERETSNERKSAAQPIGWPIVLRRVWAGLLIGPIAGLAALSISTALFVGLEALAVEHTLNMTVVSFGFPLVWAGLAVFAGYETHMLRKTVGVLGGGLLPFAFLLTAN